MKKLKVGQRVRIKNMTDVLPAARNLEGTIVECSTGVAYIRLDEYLNSDGLDYSYFGDHQFELVEDEEVEVDINTIDEVEIPAKKADLFYTKIAVRNLFVVEKAMKSIAALSDTSMMEIIHAMYQSREQLIKECPDYMEAYKIIKSIDAIDWELDD